MDLTKTCPTCGHVEDASSSTCSFCGVELAQNPEPVQAADAYPAAADDDAAAGNQTGGIEEDLLLQQTSPQKPESVDEAIAHVLSDDTEDEPLELVDAIEIETEPATAPPLQEPVPEAAGEPVPSAPHPPADEEGPVEKIVLPAPVQLKAEAAPGSAVPGAGSSKAPALEAAPAKQAEALRKHRAALARAEALKKKKLALASAVALKKRKAAMQQLPPAAGGVQIRKLLMKYVGKTIGINYDNSAKIASAALVEVNSEYLTVEVPSKGLRYHFPLPTVLSIIEGTDETGVPTGAANEVYNAVIKIFPLVLF